MNPAAAIDPTALERLERLGDAAFVGQMIDLYLDYAPGRIAAAQAAFAAGDLPALEQAVHPLRSGSGNLGALVVMQLAQRLETAAHNHEPVPLGPLLEELAAAFTCARIELEAARAKLAP